MADSKLVIAGVDEAGRGAVIGPLVIAGVSIHPEHEEKLRSIGVKDSKLLAPKRREKLEKEIEEIAKDIIILKVEACKIDNYRKEGVNLNKLEALKFGEIINFIEPDKVIIDSPEANPEKLTAFIRKMVKKETELVVEIKADQNYPVVSAASIMAKVERDRAVKEISKKYGDVGSGYPSDERAIKWLREWREKNKEYPDCVRRSWMTVEGIEKERGQSKLSGWLRRK